MPIANALGQFLRNFGQTAQGQLNEVGQLAIGGPAGYAQQQENARQAAQLAQQLNFHNSMTPYEASQLALSSSAQDAAESRAQDAQDLDVVKLLGSGAQQVPEGTPGAYKYNDVNLSFPKSKTYNLSKDSPLGQAMGLDSDLSEVPQDEYLKYMSTFADKMALGQSKKQALDAIEATVPQLTQEINDRFSPNYYKSMYGQLDPATTAQLLQSGEYARKSYLSQLQSAAASDRKVGNTSQMTTLANQLRNQQTEAEKFLNEKRMSALRIGENKANAFAQFGPAPSSESVKQWTDALETQGTDILNQAKTAHPLLPSLIEQEAAKRGINIVKMTTDQKDTRDRAGIAMPILQRALNIINQPGMEDNFGPISGRYQDFLNGKLGEGVDQRWKTVADNLVAAKGLLGKMHFSARGAANPNVQAILNSLYDEKKMDIPTLRTGIHDVLNLMQGYANAGYNGLGATGQVQQQLNLGSPSQGPAFGGK